jgi:hypothetical protein
LKARKAKPETPKPLEDMVVAIDKRRRRRIGAACTVTRAGLKIEQMLQWIYSRERKAGEVVARSWEEWAATLKCHPVTAKRNAQRALDLGLLQYSEGMTRYGGDSKNRFAIDWEGINEALGGDNTPPVDRGAKCAGEGSILRGGGEQNAHALKEVTLLVSLDTSLSTTSTNACEPSPLSDFVFEMPRHEPAEAYDVATIAAVAIVGVGKAEQFTREAIARGDDVRAILGAFKALAKAWKPEKRVFVLIDRLRNGRPGCGVSEGWPAADFPHLLPKAEKAPSTLANEPAGETARESTTRLEAIHGASLDAMPIEKRLALLTPGEVKVLGKAVTGGGARNFLLAKLEGLSDGKLEIGTGGLSPPPAHARHGPADLRGNGARSHARGSPSLAAG